MKIYYDSLELRPVNISAPNYIPLRESLPWEIEIEIESETNVSVQIEGYRLDGALKHSIGTVGKEDLIPTIFSVRRIGNITLVKLKRNFQSGSMENFVFEVKDQDGQEAEWIPTILDCRCKHNLAICDFETTLNHSSAIDSEIISIFCESPI